MRLLWSERKNKTVTGHMNKAADLFDAKAVRSAKLN